MSRFVLDASVALAWCFEDQANAYSEAAFEAISAGASALVPPLWAYEVLNVLALARRKTLLTPAQSALFWKELREFPIETAEDGDAGSEILTIAQTHGLTAYDAAYLHLAMMEGLPLATLDEDLRRAAKEAGVGLAFEASSHHRAHRKH